MSLLSVVSIARFGKVVREHDSRTEPKVYLLLCERNGCCMCVVKMELRWDEVDSKKDEAASL